MKNTATKAAKEAGKVLMQFFGQQKGNIRYKGKRQSIVTRADLASEKAIIKNIKADFPDQAILTEESVKRANLKNDYVWIIDPLDGSANFVSKNPYFAVSIALQYKKETILGVVYAPASKDLFIAEKGKGAFYNNKRIEVIPAVDIKNTVVCVDWNHCQGNKAKRINKILYKVGAKTRRTLSYGAGALSTAQVALGIFDAYFNINSYPWDHAAASLIVQEAGGVATTADGKEQRSLTYSVLVANNKLHKSLLNILKTEL